MIRFHDRAYGVAIFIFIPDRYQPIRGSLNFGAGRIGFGAYVQFDIA
jgi:hypothetical protein